MRAYRIFTRFTFWLSVIALIGAVHDAGFGENEQIEPFIQVLFLWTIAFGIGSTTVRYIEREGRPKRKVFLFDALSMLLLVFILVIQLGWVDVINFMEHKTGSTWL
ncbi:MAG: hypothetical protein R2879_12930 [Saprospiraceae bacterium]